MQAEVMQGGCGAGGKAADAAFFEPLRKMLPVRDRAVDLAQADASPHPDAVLAQEGGPELAVDQVPGGQLHLVPESGGPVPPVDPPLSDTGAPGERSQRPDPLAPTPQSGGV